MIGDKGNRGLTDIDITGVSSPCGRSGSIVTCNFGTLTIDGERRVGATLSLRAKPTATIGTAGTVHLRLASDPHRATPPPVARSTSARMWPTWS
ncbi:hypothetical protein [Catellatospora paridis]|uniref:hypothetical protein n=1 Tax=Catellatospora paridis TaxID=1617086 RepID=UPI0012D41319|nr:hypothetical protein [Catellatospora paridis]